MQRKRVANDHVAHQAQARLALADDVQPRVEDQRLPGNHADPSDEHDGGPGGPEVEGAAGFKEPDNALGDEPEGGRDEGPEVKRGAPLEGRVDDDGELERVVEGKAAEDDDGGGDRGAGLAIRGEAVRGHLGWG